MANRLVILFLFLSSILILNSSCQKSRIYESIDFKCDYLGLKEPGMIPERFAPGLVSTELMEHSPVEFSPDGKEIYWSPIIKDSTHHGVILFMKMENNQWSSPQITTFSGVYDDYHPIFSYDGNTLYFTTGRRSPRSIETGNLEIWSTQRIKTGEWSSPEPVKIPVVPGYLMTQISISKDNTLYFSYGTEDSENSWDIYCSRLLNRQYNEVQLLSDSINTKYWDAYPFISKDENYLIFTSQGRPDSFGGMDLYISFKRKDGSWSKAENMGETINSPSTEALCNVSPDGKYLFFVSDRDNNVDVYWVSSKVINQLKPKTLL